MINPEEIQYLTQFVMTRPLNGLNLFDAQKALEILKKITIECTETKTEKE